MSLSRYKQKRDFTSTPEPEGRSRKSASRLSFVVQRHKATHLHYDFRLEMDGVLKSWAIPKGPSMNPGDKRLALMVEDHPYDYKDFKGIIPEGYGAGIVEIWDKGTYCGEDEKGNAVDEKATRAALKAGNLKFSLNGKKLKGSFALVKLKNNSKGNSWLLIKHRDKYAVDTAYDSEKITAENSPINKWLKENSNGNTSANPKRKQLTAKKKIADDDPLVIGKETVQLSNLSKIYWPDKKITKGMLIDYYQEIAAYILPFLKDRPQSLKRNPNGILDKGFFQKNAGDNVPFFVQTFQAHATSTNKDVDYIVCNNKATLAYINNLGCIEINPWHSTTKKPDHPDYLLIDIDPSAKNNYDDVVEVALAFKKLLDIARITGYCKTSGASGMHIYLPMGKKYHYAEVKEFAHLLCILVNQQLPGLTTLERRLAKRNKKQIYLDYLQNSNGQTICSVYSVRPVNNACVSMPLQWEQVKKGIRPSDFTIKNAVTIIRQNPDLFKGVLGKGINIKKAVSLLPQSI
ncbi:MAG: non-homologous end-joining DNA ligase [Bacteroidetes bacterium]|nr:non-homologous end-joining DNA ligase [Bacteroidota bacterium]